MQEVTTFEEILKMQPEKFASEDDENRGRILYMTFGHFDISTG